MSHHRRLGLESCELCLSQHIVWLGCSVLAWLTAIWSSAKVSLAGLLICSIVVAAVTIALRMPVLAFVRFGNRWVTQSVWLLGCMASLNWLGFLLLSPLEARDALPGVLILLAAECWLHWQAAQRRKLPWLFNRISKALRLFAPGGTIPEPSRPSGQTPSAVAVSEVQRYEADDTQADDTQAASSSPNPSGTPGVAKELASAVDAEVKASSAGESVLRRSFEGIDEQGRKYQSGEVRVDFAAEQTLTTAVITFCTAFAGPPAVELEYEPLTSKNEGDDSGDLDDVGDELTIRPVHTTPSGLRLNLRRKTANRAAAYRLLWYAYLEAVEREPTPLRSALP